MSQSFGNRPERPSGRKGPGGPSPYGDGLRNDAAQHYSELDEEEAPQGVANRLPRKPGGTNRRAPEDTDPVGEEVEGEPRVEPGKRLVALIFDSLACYMVGMVLTVLPFVVHFVTLSSAWILLLLVKDFPFEGRGVGKNLMGLQVVDAKTGKPCTLKQSVLRNIIILAPFAVLQVISVILSFVPVPWLTEAVKGLVNAVGMVYVAVVLPVECYRVFTRDDGVRFGDQFAGTTIVESPMDFSNPFSKVK